MYYIYFVQYLVKQRWERCDSNAAGDTHTGVVPVYITHGAAERALYEQSAIMKENLVRYISHSLVAIGHDANFGATGGTAGSYDNLRCHQWRQS